MIRIPKGKKGRAQDGALRHSPTEVCSWGLRRAKTEGIYDLSKRSWTSL